MTHGFVLNIGDPGMMVMSLTITRFRARREVGRQGNAEVGRAACISISVPATFSVIAGDPHDDKRMSWKPMERRQGPLILSITGMIGFESKLAKVFGFKTPACEA